MFLLEDEEHRDHLATKYSLFLLVSRSVHLKVFSKKFFSSFFCFHRSTKIFLPKNGWKPGCEVKHTFNCFRLVLVVWRLLCGRSRKRGAWGKEINEAYLLSSIDKLEYIQTLSSLSLSFVFWLLTKQAKKFVCSDLRRMIVIFSFRCTLADQLQLLAGVSVGCGRSLEEKLP